MKKTLIFIIVLLSIPFIAFGFQRTVVRDKVPFNEIQNDDVQTGLQYLRDNPTTTRFIIRVMGVDGMTQIGRIVLTQTEAAALPGQTVNPWPVDGAIDVNPNVGPDGTCCFALSWFVDPGQATEPPSYDVYFGTTINNLQFVGNTLSSFWPPDGQTITLIDGQSYFWRVDSRTSAGVTPGDVWNFTTAIQPLP